jgi:LysM repeat protein
MIKPGDTLYSIAWRHGVDMHALAQANAIQNVNLIYVGKLLTIPSGHPAIRITSPQPGSAVNSPVTVSGESDTFEGHVAVRVLDANWQVIGEGVGIGGGYGTYAPFSMAVSFTGTGAQRGVVEAWWNRPQDGAEVDTVSVSVYLSGGPPAGHTYTVLRGDNLYRIALRFGTTMQALVQANNIGDPDFIYVGQVLRIP